MGTRIMLILVAGALIVGFLAILYQRPDPIEDVTAAWTSSGHADTSAEAWVHWDEDEPPVIPARCAKCHSLYGYLDYLGADGSARGEVNADAQTGTVLFCHGCHNEAIEDWDTVIYPSGEELTVTGPEIRCMQCHQGTASTDRVLAATAGIADDQVDEELGFINVHYAIAAATKAGGEARVAFQYPDQTYVGFYEHFRTMKACVDCHDPHALQIDPDSCSPCHSNVVNYADMWAIRYDPEVDFDGDGEVEEGIAGEIETLHERLGSAIQTYAADVIGTPIVYADAFPYWFTDIDGDGEPDADEAVFPNAYASWTPRLLRLAYNYHYVNEDPGAFVHNPDYVLQFLYDGLADASQAIDVETADLVRP